MLGCLSQGIVEPVEKLKGRSRSQSPMPRSIHVMVFTVKHSLETSHTNLKCLQSFGLAVAEAIQETFEVQITIQVKEAAMGRVMRSSKCHRNNFMRLNCHSFKK
ncbi:uncharacterized protein LOC110872915 isoform X5 [Helianthus annuus]|uniref:uncharacterized protein LOC110872915 isoform X5 n=1 Tax=Helianthus annuus TaxID=4232 RepID=UPI000B8FA205|nr:uncharacterized protein LOC110872915 isoform X5 [Helianthus annuus]